MVEAPERRITASGNRGLGGAHVAPPGAVGLELEAESAQADPIGGLGQESGAVASGLEHRRLGLDGREVAADSLEIRPRPIGGQPERVAQGVVGGPGVEIEQPAGVRRALGADPPPLLVHVVVAGNVILDVPPVRPRGVGVVDVEPALLAELPPPVAPLEDEPADGVSHPALAVGLLVDLLPLPEEIARLHPLVLAHLLLVEGVRPELGEHDRDPQLVLDHLEEIAGGDPPVDVGAQDVEVRALLGDDVDVLDVAVGDGHRAVRILRLHHVDDVAEEGVELVGAGHVPFALRERFRLEGGPGEAVVVLVPQEPHQYPGNPAELLDQVRHVGGDRGPDRRIGVVDVRDPHPVQGVPVAAAGVVDDGVDAVALVDVADPAGGNPHVLPDGVHPHVPEQRHLPGQRLLDQVVGLLPEAVEIVLADGDVVPVHAVDHEVPPIHLETGSRVVGDHPHGGRGVRGGPLSPGRGGGGGQGGERPRQDEDGMEGDGANRSHECLLAASRGASSWTPFAATTSRYQNALSLGMRCRVEESTRYRPNLLVYPWAHSKLSRRDQTK